MQLGAEPGQGRFFAGPYLPPSGLKKETKTISVNELAKQAPRLDLTSGGVGFSTLQLIPQRLYLHPPSDHSIGVSQRAAFNGLLSRVVPSRVFVFGVFRPQSADRPKKLLGFPFPGTTKAQTQMEPPLVDVQGHQKQLENTNALVEIDVFVWLVVQDPPEKPRISCTPHWLDLTSGGVGFSTLQTQIGPV